MPFDGTKSDIDTDFEILEAIGTHYQSLTAGVINSGAALKTVRRWLLGHCDDVPEDYETQLALTAMAVDLELFTPSSISGRTQIDRNLASRRPETEIETQAAAALGAAQFRLVRIVGCEGDDLIRLVDLATQEDLLLLHSLISPLAVGAPTAMRLCPLASGRQVLISPRFLIDEAMLSSAMTFVKPGKPLGNGHRCAASLYRDAARRGFIPMPTRENSLSGATESFDDADFSVDLSEVQMLAFRWMASEGAAGQAGLIESIRQAACLDTLVDACGLLAKAQREGRDHAAQTFTRIAEIKMETLAERTRAGMLGHVDILDGVATALAGHIAAGRMYPEALHLFSRLRARIASGDSRDRNRRASTDGADLDRVIQLIRGLRAKTVDQGCTEQEAMAAAAKVAELLARHDLTLDEIAVRKSECVGAAVETHRRRGAPVEACVQTVANFCDCRAWLEQGAGGTRRHMFFGLKGDVEAARFLYELIENTFETESVAFRRTDIYQALCSAHRRTALSSFQIGLANGVIARLDALKAARTETAAKATGFDLVAVKHATVDEELQKLGLEFVSLSAPSRRRIYRDAFDAGKAAGARFEPHAHLVR